jgi:glycerol uptake facilitator-like aquaporin
LDSAAVFIAEMLGAFCLAYGVASVAFGKAPGAANGLTIGGSLLFGLSIAAAAGSHAVLNPAVAVGLSCVSVVYLTAPIVGGVIAMQLYRFVQSE